MARNPIAELIHDIRQTAPLEFSPRLPPWSRLRRDRSAVSRLRCAVTRLGSLRGGSRAGRVKLLLVALFWPVKATFDGMVSILKFGPRVKAASGVGYLRQWWDAMTLAHRWNYSPKTYYTYRVWDAAARGQATRFLQRHEMAALQMFLNEGGDRSTISNKSLFEARCTRAGIPTPTVVAMLSAGSEEWAAPEAGLPRHSLFLKRVNGTQGRGGERWLYDAASDRWLRNGESLAEANLLERVRRMARTHPMLIQPCLTNHPEIERYSPGPLSTFRVVTYLGASGAPVLLGMTLKMGRKGADADNMHAGGFACPVDPVTGELGPGLGLDPGEPLWSRHPDTREPIAGARLSTHAGVIDIAINAHRSLPVPWSVGWDVAMTPDGPVLIEGNAVWGAAILQAPHRAGVSEEFAVAALDRITAIAASVPRQVPGGDPRHGTFSPPGLPPQPAAGR